MSLSARQTVERHAQAAIDGKMDIVMADLTAEMLANIQPLADTLGKVQPKNYQILDEKQESANWVFKVKYVGQDSNFIVNSTWALQDDAWKVITATPE